jgi:hypothetical protein
MASNQSDRRPKESNHLMSAFVVLDTANESASSGLSFAVSAAFIRSPVEKYK